MTIKHIKLKKQYYVPVISLALFMAFIFGANSCANPGVGPQGGPRDSIPPQIIQSVPLPLQTNFKGNEISLTFNEYVLGDNLASELVISPPLSEKLTVKMRGKSINIKINEPLAENRTYSVDFMDLIKDYNEGNKLESFRMLFSTYEQIDTLRIDGYLVDAFTHEPLENSIATLYATVNDTLFKTTKPDYIAKTNDNGYFLFDNLSEGEYQLFGLVDGDNNMYFSRANEQIAFHDSLFYPKAIFTHTSDTTFEEGADTVITSSGFTTYTPSEVIAFLFTEDVFNQTLLFSRREKKNYLLLAFNEQLTDSFNFELVGFENTEDLIYQEMGSKNDSVFIWLTDSLLVSTDTLLLKIDYTVTDSLMQYFTRTDTLKMAYTEPRRAAQQQNTKQNESETNEIKLFNFNTNLSAANFDLNNEVYVISPDPLTQFGPEHLSLKIALTDSTFDPVDFELITLSKRKYKVEFDIQPETTYILYIDSASVKSLMGEYNDAFETKFKTQKTEYYGTAAFDFTNFDDYGLVQLLKNSKNEELVIQKIKEKGQKQVSFDFLKPGKYKVKFIDDRNQNSKWESGNYLTKTQPEAVYYFPKIINIKSNWDLKESWDIVPGKFTPKEFSDDDKK